MKHAVWILAAIGVVLYLEENRANHNDGSTLGGISDQIDAAVPGSLHGSTWFFIAAALVFGYPVVKKYV